jgi:hypothetical protein
LEKPKQALDSISEINTSQPTGPFMKKLSSRVHQFFMAARYTQVHKLKLHPLKLKGVLTMKYLGVWLAGGVTLMIILAIGIFSFLPQETPPQPAVVVSAPPTAVQLQANLAEREATYQSQINQLNQTLQERQSTYQQQLQEMSLQLTAAQNQLQELKAQEQNLLVQAAQLETTRAERLAAYQAQLEQSQAQANTRHAQWQTQLTEAQTKLAEAQTQLGQ